MPRSPAPHEYLGKKGYRLINKFELNRHGGPTQQHRSDSHPVSTPIASPVNELGHANRSGSLRPSAPDNLPRSERRFCQGFRSRFRQIWLAGCAGSHELVYLLRTGFAEAVVAWVCPCSAQARLCVAAGTKWHLDAVRAVVAPPIDRLPHYGAGARVSRLGDCRRRTAGT